MTDQPKKSRRRHIRVEMPPSLETHYANVVMIGHAAGEVVFDFVHMMPNLPMARVQTRVVLSPTNAKLLQKALSENLEKYEQKFGEIQTPPTLADQLFSLVRPSGMADEDTASEVPGDDADPPPDDAA